MAELWPWFAVLFLAVFVTGLTLWWFAARLEFIRDRLLSHEQLVLLHNQLLLAMTALLEHHQDQLQKLTSHEQDKSQ